MQTQWLGSFGRPPKKDDYLLIERFGLQLMVPLTLTDLQCFYLNT